MSKTILLVSGAAPPIIDGVGHYTARLLETLRAARPRWRWVWLTRKARWFHRPIASFRGVRIVRPAHGWYGAAPWLAGRVVRWVRPDLLHIQEQTHSFYQTDAAIRIANSARCPVVTTVHEFHGELPGCRHTVALVERSAAVITNDGRTGRRCAEATGREPDAIWWSPSNVPPLEGASRPRTKPGLVTTFGHINVLKALDAVFEGLGQLRRRQPGLRWRLIGPTPAAPERYFDLMRNPWVEFAGGWPDLYDMRLRLALAETHVMLLPFLDGATTRRTTLQAAWAFGLPVVTTAPELTEDAIVPEWNCLLVEPRDAVAWAGAVERILTDPALEARLRAGSAETARKYSWDRLASLHLSLYDRLLGAGT